MTCRLCDRDLPLKNSHIYPEFFFTTIYSAKQHRFLSVPLEDFEGLRLHQKGLREKLLCGECEGKLSRWETYSSRLLRGELAATTHEARDRHIVSGIDYAMFKLFHMSLIWRAGITTLSDFKAVFLGPHVDRLKSFLFAGDPGEEGDYPCMFAVLPDPLDVFGRAMMLPLGIRIDEHRSYFSVAAGLLWVFLVSGHAGSYQHRDCFLSKNGELTILKGTMSLANRMIGSMKQQVARARSRPDSHKLKDWGYE